MGHPMPDVPHIYGNNCLLGFPEGKTPKYMYARFSGMAYRPEWKPVRWHIPPNDRTFKLEQIEEDHCWWQYLSDDWLIQFIIIAGPLRIEFFLLNNLDRSWYFAENPEGHIDEGTVYNNDDALYKPEYQSTDGIATVTWTQEATNLLKSINMQRADDLFMELRPLVDGNKVYKFCRLRDATNIAIEFEPD